MGIPKSTGISECMTASSTFSRTTSRFCKMPSRCAPAFFATLRLAAFPTATTISARSKPIFFNPKLGDQPHCPTRDPTSSRAGAYPISQVCQPLNLVDVVQACTSEDPAIFSIRDRESVLDPTFPLAGSISNQTPIFPRIIEILPLPGKNLGEGKNLIMTV
jgi:hypothetical protein